MDVKADWQRIKRVFDEGIKSSMHCAIASVDGDGSPHVTPIGFVFLREDGSLYYFEQYAKALPANIARNKNVCVMAVNGGRPFWLRALLVGKFAAHPGVRLHGQAGESRPARPDELDALRKRIGLARLLKGGKLIWSGLQTVRDVRITGVSPVVYPRMMEHLL